MAMSPVPINKSLTRPHTHIHALMQSGGLVAPSWPTNSYSFKTATRAEWSKSPHPHTPPTPQPGPRHQPFIIQLHALWMAYRWMLRLQQRNTARKSQHSDTHTHTGTPPWNVQTQRHPRPIFCKDAEPEDAKPCVCGVKNSSVRRSSISCVLSLLLLFN